MRADGWSVRRVGWGGVGRVEVRNGGQMVMWVDPAAAQGLHPVPPVLMAVDNRRDSALLRFDLSETDVPQPVLISFLRATEPIPASPPDE